MRVAVHHEDTKGTKARRYRNGSLDPDNIKLVVLAPLTDGLRWLSHLRGGFRVLRVSLVDGRGSGTEVSPD